MTTDKPAGEMPDDETPAAWWVRFPDGSGCIYEDKAYADSYAAQVSYRTVTVIPVYTRADKPDAADEWNEFREHLNTVCSKEELQKMINGCEIVIRRVFYSGDHAEIMKELNIRYALISKRMEELILQREAEG